jgi:hypothetical protein
MRLEHPFAQRYADCVGSLAIQRIFARHAANPIGPEKRPRHYLVS